MYVLLRIFRNFFSHNKKSQNFISNKDKYFFSLCLNRVAGNLRNKQPTKTLPVGAYEEHCLISYKSTRSKLNTLSCLVLN